MFARNALVFLLALAAPVAAQAGPGAWHRVTDSRVHELPRGPVLNARLDAMVEGAELRVDHAKSARKAEKARLREARKALRHARWDRFKARFSLAKASRLSDTPGHAHMAVHQFESHEDEVDRQQQHVRWHRSEVRAAREEVRTARHSRAYAKAQREVEQAQALASYGANIDVGLYERQLDRNAENLRDQKLEERIAESVANGAEQAYLASY